MLEVKEPMFAESTWKACPKMTWAVRPKTLLQLPTGTANMVAGMASSQPRDSGESPAFVGPNDSKSLFYGSVNGSIFLWFGKSIEWVAFSIATHS